MRHRFDGFELDTQNYSLSAGGSEIHLEPLVFDLLRFFVEHVGEVLSRDVIIQQVWHGRFVSDATVSSCIKSARRALGDSGETQTYIRTIRGRGFQFLAAIATEPAGLEVVRSREPEPSAGIAPNPKAPDAGLRLPDAPKIAVLPLFPLSLDPTLGHLGDALSQEIILELSRLHWLFVIARGSTFKFRGQDVDLDLAKCILGADYVLTGTIMEQAGQCYVAVELCHATDRNVIWAERYTSPRHALVSMQSTIAGEIAGALEPRIQNAEAMQAAQLPTEHLDAWASYHRGLWHMYRFNRHNNAVAAGLFAKAVELDPKFARAHAGLSFTHFQNALLGYVSDPAHELARQRYHADRSYELDPLDPVINLTMGRAEWLAGNLEQSVPWMKRAIALSPNYAFAIYNSALIGTFLGEGEVNERRITRAISLSPVDPLNYAMLATRAMTHAVRGNHETAADWADRAVQAPNAHIQIYAIAALTNELAGRRAKADAYIAHIRSLHPGFCRVDFTKSFPFRDGVFREQISAALQRLGL